MCVRNLTKISSINSVKMLLQVFTFNIGDIIVGDLAFVKVCDTFIVAVNTMTGENKVINQSDLLALIINKSCIFSNTTDEQIKALKNSPLYKQENAF